MTILTGIVLIVALGAVVQRGDLFGQDAGVAPRDDVATLAPGFTYLIDVTANDRGARPGDSARLLITEAPACGVVERREGGLAFRAEARCEGPLRLTYCLALGESCPSAEVTLVLADDARAEASATGTPVARLDEPLRPAAMARVSPAPAASAFTPELPQDRAPAGPLAALASAFGSLAPDEAEAGAAGEAP
ncbi:MAG: hypothetical protein ACQEUZ_07255 [Pseudomonadota bacterium]